MKNSYILLRKNEESGPFEFEDLQKMGLQPGDLIWVEGQSVSWQSPSEIQELKKIQFKEPGQEKVIESEYRDGLNTIISSTLNGNHSKDKSVFIALPDEVVPVANDQPTTKIFVTTAKQKSATPLPVPNSLKPSVTSNEVNTLEKEINIPVAQKAKRRTAGFSLKDVAIFIGLPLLGFLTGIAIKEYTTGSSTKNDLVPSQTEEQQNTNIDADPASAEFTDANLQTPLADSFPLTGNNITQTAEKTVKPVKKPGKSESQKNTSTNENIVAPPVNRKDNATNTGEENKQEAISPEQLASMVFISNNDYKTGAFGGIKDLQLTVTNDSKYILEKVLVQLQYLKPNEEAIKTETLVFTSVPPNGTQTISVDKSNRGVKIKYKVIKVEPGKIIN